jgi:HK97 family phage major capsid protein
MKVNPKVMALYESAAALHAKGAEILATFEGKDLPADKGTEAKGFLDQAEAKIAEAQMHEKSDALGAFLKEPRQGLPALFGAPAAAAGPFKGLGEQLMAVKDLAKGTRRDERLFEVMAQAKALGMSEEIGSEGGFLLQPGFTAEIFRRAYEVGQLAARCKGYPVNPASNSLTINAIDEQSRATGSRYGGMQSYWVAPGVTVTPSMPKFRQIELRLKKLMSLHYATDEELADVSVLESIVGDAATEEIAWMVDEAILTGSGAGMPLGILNSPCLVTVAKETGQVAGSVVTENIAKMWGRSWGRGRANAVWLINQDVEPSLDVMSLTVGVGGVPTYFPPGGIADAAYGRLKGRPVLTIENCPTLGAVGDIVLAELDQYLLANKGGVQAASSIHVQFLTDQSVFRFIFRVDGQPAWNTPLTPAKGSNTLSPFVALAARA